jgi:predicted nicotinamide N-methyase
MAAARWVLDERLRIMLPASDTKRDGSAEQYPVIAFFSTAEALQSNDPWPRAECEEGGQQAAHDRSAPTGKLILGYASWLTHAAAHAKSSPLIIREAVRHIGTRIWAGSWLLRRWTLEHPQCFPRGARVLEMGAGCGLVGLSVAAAHGVSVKLSDFRGHGADDSADSDTVMHNLVFNSYLNSPMIERCGGSTDVIELDWARPREPKRWCLDACCVDCLAERLSGAHGTCDPERAPTSPRLTIPVTIQQPTLVEAVDVILAAEVLYTEAGTRLFVSTLTAWLAKPAGTCYLVNNKLRTDVERLKATCTSHGLAVEQLHSFEGGDDGVTSTFAPPWDDVEVYLLLRVTWLCP